jgi:transketolase
MANIDELKKIAEQVRRDIVRMVYNAQSGHPGGSLGCADFMTALYFEIMDRKPGFDMDGKGEDIFFLSNGHISPVWYSVLARSGYFPISELNTYRQINSRVQGHPATAEHLPGIRVASGSLGQGMSVAIGAALAKKYNGDDKLVYSLHGDGELEEGQNWEAIMFAPNKKVDNLISTIDWNGQQIDGPVDKVMSLGDLHEKFASFGWIVMETYGNVIEEVITTLQVAKTKTGKGKPVIILMRTHMGYGVDFMLDNYKWHGSAPNKDQFESAMKQLPATLVDF